MRGTLEVSQCSGVFMVNIFIICRSPLSRCLYHMSLDGRSVFPGDIEGLSRVSIQDAIAGGGLSYKVRNYIH